MQRYVQQSLVAYGVTNDVKYLVIGVMVELWLIAKQEFESCAGSNPTKILISPSRN